MYTLATSTLPFSAQICVLLPLKVGGRTSIVGEGVKQEGVEENGEVSIKREEGKGKVDAER
jgi:hypothetical protein